jgi:hypothetical protein
MTKLEQNTIQSLPSVISVDDKEILINYDLGDETDVEKFQSNFDKLIDVSNFKTEIDLNIEFLPDENIEEGEEQICSWSIANIIINTENNISFENIENIIEKLETI